MPERRSDRGIAPTPDVSPFQRALWPAGTFQVEFARQLGVNHAAIPQWCAGTRRPPPEAYALLATLLAPGQALQLQCEHEAWLTEREAAARFTFTAKLPDGVTHEQAEHEVAEGLRTVGRRGSRRVMGESGPARRQRQACVPTAVAAQIDLDLSAKRRVIGGGNRSRRAVLPSS